jgi:hypothetical protein
MNRMFIGRVVAIATALCASALLVTGTATAAPSVGQERHAYQDYLHVSNGAVTAGSSGSEQCGTPLAQRVGRWLCLDTPASAKKFGPAGTGFCDGWACRYRYDDFEADVEVAGNWGWGDQQLGTMQGYADFQLAGAQTTSKPVQYTNTAYTTEVVFSGNLLNAAPGVAGDPVDGTFSVYNAGDVVAGGSTSWLPNGYKSYDNTMWDHSQVIEWAFSAPDYPGYWYLYAKSTCTHTDDKVIYRFDGVDQVPADPDGAGWNQ